MPAPPIAPSGLRPSDRCDVLCVAPDRVAELWPHARALVARAFIDRPGDDTIESTEAEVLAGRELLWIAWGEGRILAAGTTALIRVPRGKVCLIKACGGVGLNRWLRKVLALIEAYAKAEGCDSVRMYGRRGWRRRLPGYSEPWIVLEKDVRG